MSASAQCAEPTAYPVFLQDAVKANRVLIALTLHFNDVLDVQVVRDSLSQLLRIGHWRKLTGRLHQNVRAPALGPLPPLIGAPPRQRLTAAGTYAYRHSTRRKIPTLPFSKRRTRRSWPRTRSASCIPQRRARPRRSRSTRPSERSSSPTAFRRASTPWSRASGRSSPFSRPRSAMPPS